MFGKRKKTALAASSKMENVIGPSASLNGHFKADGGIRVDGIFEGEIETAGNVIISEEAKVIADITAQNVSVAGTVKGNINAIGRLEILATGRVWGDISVSSFLIDEGGFFYGQSTMQGDMEPPLSQATTKVRAE